VVAATRAFGRRFVVMSQVSWQTMIREFAAAAHVVTGLLPREDAAAGLAEVRAILLGRLARTLRLTGNYAIAEIIERDGTHVQCALASGSDAAELAEAVGANENGCSRWASRRSFQFDHAAAKAIERAVGHVPAGTLPQSAKPPALP
jgi:hypothetical protein